jgi:hypothetical protein
MKWRSTAFVLLFGALPAIAQSTPPDKNPPEMSDAKFDATRLRTGRFEYRIVRDGKQIATFTITVDKQSDGNFRFAARGLQSGVGIRCHFFFSADLGRAADRTTGEKGDLFDETHLQRRSRDRISWNNRRQRDE